MGGKVLVSTQDMVDKLVAARLASDIMDVPTLIIGRTDSLAGDLLQNDGDITDHKFLTGVRTSEGFYRVKAGMDQAVARGLAYAPYCDLLWMETAVPDIGEVTEFVKIYSLYFPIRYLHTTVLRHSTGKQS